MGTRLMLSGRVCAIISAAPLSQQFQAHRAAESRGMVRRALLRHLDEAVAGFIEHGSGQRHVAAGKRGVAGDRRVADQPFNTHSTSRSASAQSRDEPSSIFARWPRVSQSFSTDSDRDDALPHRRQHFANPEIIGNPRGHSDPLEPRPRHDKRIRRTHLAAVGKALLVAAIEFATAYSAAP